MNNQHSLFDPHVITHMVTPLVEQMNAPICVVVSDCYYPCIDKYFIPPSEFQPWQAKLLEIFYRVRTIDNDDDDTLDERGMSITEFKNKYQIQIPPHIETDVEKEDFNVLYLLTVLLDEWKPYLNQSRSGRTLLSGIYTIMLTDM